jgi:hypothetical protein
MSTDDKKDINFHCEMESADYIFTEASANYVGIYLHIGSVSDEVAVLLTPHNARAFANEINRIADLVDGEANEAS